MFFPTRFPPGLTLPAGVLALVIAVVASGPTASDGETGGDSVPPAAGQRRKCVLVIGIDGLRSDGLRAAHTPVLDGLAACGAVSHDAFAGGVPGTRTQQITSSGPGWSSIFTGVWADKHRVRDNGFGGHRLQQYPHFFKFWKERRPEAVLASFVDWEEIDTFIVASSSGAFDYRFPNGRRLPGSYVERDAMLLDDYERFMASNNPDGLVVYLGNVDIAGHGTGFSPANPLYITAIEKADEQVGRVLEVLRARPEYDDEDWLTIVTTDHGGLGTSHGGQSRDERTIFMIASGGDVRPRVISPGPGHVAVPATAMRHLGIPVDGAWGWEAPAFGYPPYCPGGFVAVPDPRLGVVDLSWLPPEGHDLASQQLLRDGEVIAELGIETSRFADSPVLPATGEAVEFTYTLRMTGKDAGECPPLAARAAFYLGPPEWEQVAHLAFDGSFDDPLSSLTPFSTSGRFSRDNAQHYLELGIQDSVRFDTSPKVGFGSSTDFTVGFLVKAGAAPAILGTIVGNRAYSGSALRGWAVAATRAGSLKWEIGDGVDSARFETEAGLLDDGRWHHVMVTHDRDDRAALFVDGILRGRPDISLVGNIGSDGGITVGGRFAGGIDDLRIWSRALLPDEVPALAGSYGHDRPPHADAAVDLRFDGPTQVADAPGIVSTAVGQLQYGDGVRGAAALLQNTGEQAPVYLSLGDAEALRFGATQDFTVSVWVKSEGEFGLGGAKSDPAIVSNKDWKTGAGKGWIIASGNDGRWQWNMGDGDSRHRQDYDGPAGQISDGQWHHIAVSHDRDGNAEFFFDGQHVASRSIAEVGDIDSGLPTAIGTDGMFGTTWPAWFNGAIDNLQVWRRTLSAAEVAFLFRHFTAPEERPAESAISVAIVGRYAHVQYQRLAGGFGRSGWDYTAGGIRHRLERLQSPDAESWESAPGLFRQVAPPVSVGNNRERVTLQSMLPVPLAGEQYFRLQRLRE